MKRKQKGTQQHLKVEMKGEVVGDELEGDGDGHGCPYLCLFYFISTFHNCSYPQPFSSICGQTLSLVGGSLSLMLVKFLGMSDNFLLFLFGFFIFIKWERKSVERTSENDLIWYYFSCTSSIYIYSELIHWYFGINTPNNYRYQVLSINIFINLWRFFIKIFQIAMFNNSLKTKFYSLKNKIYL